MKHNCQVDKSVEDIILLWMYSNVIFHRSAMTCAQSSCAKFNNYNYLIEFILKKQKQNAHFFMIIINYANYIFLFFVN